MTIGRFPAIPTNDISEQAFSFSDTLLDKNKDGIKRKLKEKVSWLCRDPFHNVRL